MFRGLGDVFRGQGSDSRSGNSSGHGGSSGSGSGSGSGLAGGSGSRWGSGIVGGRWGARDSYDFHTYFLVSINFTTSLSIAALALLPLLPFFFPL